MKITKYAQSTFVIINSEKKTLLIDPGIYNFNNKFGPENFGKVDIILVTHKHRDHFDIEALKSFDRATTILTNPEVASLLHNESMSSVIVHPGDRIEIGGYELFVTKSDHFVRGEYVVNFGIVMIADGKKIYHTSDTRMIDLNQLPKAVIEPDILCVPISNRGIVMGIDDALYFTNEIMPRIVIPMHYDSPKDKHRIKPEHFSERKRTLEQSLENLADIEVKILGFGEELIIN